MPTRLDQGFQKCLSTKPKLPTGSWLDDDVTISEVPISCHPRPRVLGTAWAPRPGLLGGKGSHWLTAGPPRLLKEEVSSLMRDSKLWLKCRNGGLLPKFPSFGKSWHRWENMFLSGAQSPPNSLLRQYLRPTEWPFFSDLHCSSSTSSLCRPFPISQVH